MGVTKAIGYEWLKRWNSKGYNGLIPDSEEDVKPVITLRDRGKAGCIQDNPYYEVETRVMLGWV